MTSRRSLTLAVCLVLVAGAAAAADKVQILRGPSSKKAQKTVEPERQDTAKKQAEQLNVKEQSLNVRETELKAKEAELTEREAEQTKAKDEARKREEAEKQAKAKQQKALEDVARKTHSEFGNAADALGGE